MSIPKTQVDFKWVFLATGTGLLGEPTRPSPHSKPKKPNLSDYYVQCQLSHTGIRHPPLNFTATSAFLFQILISLFSFFWHALGHPGNVFRPKYLDEWWVTYQDQDQEWSACEMESFFSKKEKISSSASPYLAGLTTPTTQSTRTFSYQMQNIILENCLPTWKEPPDHFSLIALHMICIFFSRDKLEFYFHKAKSTRERGKTSLIFY